MGVSRHYKKNMRTKFEQLKASYSRLGKNIKEALETFLIEKEISFLSVDFRLKNIDSFLEKIDRKSYNDPFNDIEDICGLRIICYYQSDIKKICQVINSEFDIKENQDKEELLEEDQFGYRSHHFVGKVKKKWLEAPNYRGLENLKFEIQVRTVLMHAWAEIEHKLAYKQEIHIPTHLKRKLYRISAKLEEADEQFEDIKNESIQYRKKLTDSSKTKGEAFYYNLNLNLDSLQSFLDFKFPTRKKNINETRSLLDELVENEIGLNDIISGFKTVESYLIEIEQEIFKERLLDGISGWAQVGIVRKILDITNDRYYDSRFSDLKKTHQPTLVKQQTDNWRKKITTA